MFILPLASEKRGTSDRLEDVEIEAKGKNIRGGAVVMIGPIPVLVGSDPKTALLMMLISLVIMLVWRWIQTWIGNRREDVKDCINIDRCLRTHLSFSSTSEGQLMICTGFMIIFEVATALPPSTVFVALTSTPLTSMFM